MGIRAPNFQYVWAAGTRTRRLCLTRHLRFLTMPLDTTYELQINEPDPIYIRIAHFERRSTAFPHVG
jgi:hypothetical protein